MSQFKRSKFKFLWSSFHVSGALNLIENSPECDVWTWRMFKRLYVPALVLYNPHMKVFVVYLLMLELFVDKIHVFKFLSMSDKPLGLAKNYHCYLYTVQTSLNYSIRTRKEKYPVLKTNTKFHQLIKLAKISYPIASLVFWKFSCVTYRNGSNRYTWRLKHLRYFKECESC